MWLALVVSVLFALHACSALVGVASDQGETGEVELDFKNGFALSDTIDSSRQNLDYR